MRELGVYMRSLLNHWVAWGTGSFLVLVLWILDSVYHWKIPKWALLAFLVVGLLVSSFQAWSDEYRENEAARLAGSLPLEGLQLIMYKHEGKNDGALQIEMTLRNTQNRLIEYRVDEFDLEVGSKKAGSNFSNQGGYAYANTTTIFRSPSIPVDDTSQLVFSGTLEYVISYHVVQGTEVHHSSKTLKFDAYTHTSLASGRIQYLTIKEHED